MNIIYVNEKSLRVKSYRTEQIEQSINLPALGEFEIKERHWWNDLPSLYIHGWAIMYSSRNMNQVPWAVCWVHKVRQGPCPGTARFWKAGKQSITKLGDSCPNQEHLEGTRDSLYSQHPFHRPWASKGSENEVAQSCPTLCDPMDCSLPGSFVHGIFQAIVLEWIAISVSSKGREDANQSEIIYWFYFTE